MTTPSPGTPEHPEGRSTRSLLMIAGVIACLGTAIAVALLGTLVVRNFLSFNCRSLQSEAKMHLAGLYTAEKAFYAEYDTYTSDLVALHWQPDSSPRYVVGFAHPGPGLSADKAHALNLTDYDESRSDTANPALSSNATSWNPHRMQTFDGMALSALDLPRTSVEKDAFVAGAAGDIDTDPATQLDLWTIDNHRVLTNVFDDCSN